MANNLNTINNQFEFNFPIDFVSERIEKKYLKYLKDKRKMHDSVLDYLNSTIKDIDFPNIEFNKTNTQNKKRKIIEWKAVDNIYDLFDKTATLTINNVDSNINYFILLDILTEKYLDVGYAYDENLDIVVVDENRNALYQIQFRDVMWTGLDGIKLAYNQQQMTDNTFTMKFYYNYLDIMWFGGSTTFINDSLK